MIRSTAPTQRSRRWTRLMKFYLLIQLNRFAQILSLTKTATPRSKKMILSTTAILICFKRRWTLTRWSHLLQPKETLQEMPLLRAKTISRVPGLQQTHKYSWSTSQPFVQLLTKTGEKVASIEFRFAAGFRDSIRSFVC